MRKYFVILLLLIFTLNLKAKYSVNSNFTIFTGIENLLDKRYRSYSSGLVAPGLNASLTAFLITPLL